MYVYFKNRKNVKFSSDLGFDSYGIYRMDDNMMPMNEFTDYLASLMDMKLLTHD